MRKLLGFIVAILVVVPSVAGAVPIRLDNKGAGLDYLQEPVTGAWDVGSLADATDTEDLSQYWSDGGSYQDIDIANDGQYMFYVNNRDTVYRFTFSDPGNLGAGINKSQEVNFSEVSGSSIDGWITGVHISKSGDTLILADRNVFAKFSLDSAYDLSNPTFEQEDSLDKYVYSLNFGEQGKNFYFNKDRASLHYQTLSSSYDLSSRTTSDTWTDSELNFSIIHSMAVKPDGSIFYLTGYNSNLDTRIFREWSLSTNYDFSTRTVGDDATYPSNDNYGIDWGYLGNDFYSVGGSNYHILHEYPATN